MALGRYMGTTKMSRFENAKIQDLKGDLKIHSIEYLRAFSKDKSVGMILSGPYGVGKTYSAAAILNQITALTPYVWRGQFPKGPFLPVSRSSGDRYQRSAKGPLRFGYGIALAVAGFERANATPIFFE